MHVNEINILIAVTMYNNLYSYTVYRIWTNYTSVVSVTVDGSMRFLMKLLLLKHHCLLYAR